MTSPDDLRRDPVEQQDGLYSISVKDEIGRIEAVGQDVENSEKDEKMKGFIEKESKDELNNIKSQCLNVIGKYDGTEEKKEATAQAILSLLRINQILGSLTIKDQNGESLSINLKSNCFEQLVNIVGTKKFDFKAILGNEDGEIVNNACKIWDDSLNKLSQEDEENNKKKEQLKNKEGIITSLENLINKYNSYETGKAFNELKKDVNNDPNLKKTFASDVFGLIDICCASLTGQEGKLKSDFSSDKIMAFQSLVVENAEKGGVYEEALKDLTLDGKYSNEQVVDGKLGRNTLKCLIKYAEDGLKFEPKPIERKGGTAKFESANEKNETGDVIGQMPTVFSAIKKYGDLSDKNGYKIFSFKNTPGKDTDFVKRESGTGNEYVQIGGKKFYINLNSGEGNDLQFRNIPVQRSMYGDVQNTTDLCFGIFNEKGILVEGSKITIDSEGRQIGSLIMTDHEVKSDENESLGKIGLRTLGEKRRIDFFEKDGKDTKRFSDEQLDALIKDDDAIKIILDLAINAYSDTMHKPSTIGRDNLNSLISRLLISLDDNAAAKKIITSEIHSEACFNSSLSRKERVASFLRLEYGLFSNPEHKINKNDLDEGERNKYNNLKTNEKKREYRGTLMQGDRIISRLELLKKALEGKTDNNPDNTGIDGINLENSDNIPGNAEQRIGELEDEVDENGKVQTDITGDELSKTANTIDEITVFGKKGTLDMISPDDFDALSIEQKKDWAKRMIDSDEYGYYLKLPIRKLDPEVAKVLIESKKGLNLGNLTDLDEESAKILGKFKGSLNLSGIKYLSEDALSNLSKPLSGGSDYYKGKELILGITDLTEEGCKYLVKGPFQSLELSGLSTLKQGVADELSKFPGDLDLQGLTTLSKDDALALLKHNGDSNIWLRNLKELDDDAADALTYHNPLTLQYGYCNDNIKRILHAKIEEKWNFSEGGNEASIKEGFKEKLYNFRA